LDQHCAVEAWGKDEQRCLIFSDGSVSGVVNLQRDLMIAPRSGGGRLATESQALLLRPDANTNLMMQRTLIPTVRHTLFAEAESKSPAEMWLATGIFAVSKTSGIDVTEAQKLWLKRPRIQVTAKPGEEDEIRVILY
jgi:hypothetical protein